jgi:hypothetical protein
MSGTGIRYALRRLAAAPILSLAALLTLSLGIGSAAMMGDVVDRLLLRAPAHVSDPERVSRVYVGIQGRSYVQLTEYSTFEAISGMREELAAAAAYFAETLSLGRGERARAVETVAHTADYFPVLGVQPLLGFWPLAPGAPQRDDAAAISYGLWQQEFGGRGDVLGKPLVLGLDTYTITAVAPRGFAGLESNGADVWLPLEPRARATYGASWKTQPLLFLRMAVRLNPGASRAGASEHATALYRAAHTEAWTRSNTVVLGDIRPARAPGVTLGNRVEVLVAGVSMLLLLITCGNAASILLVRGLRRSREFVVKTALGASRGRLLREVFAEAAVLAAGAGGAALLVLVIGGAAMRRVFQLPAAGATASLDVRQCLIVVTFSIVAALVLGLAPALRLTARRALSPGHAVHTPPSRLLDAFAALQIAMCLPMVIVAVLFVMSLMRAGGQDFGMRTDRVAVVTTNLFEVGRPFETHAAHRRIQARLSSLPQVESTAMVSSLPMRSNVSSLIAVPGKDLFANGPLSSDSMPGINGVGREPGGRGTGCGDQRVDGQGVLARRTGGRQVLFPRRTGFALHRRDRHRRRCPPGTVDSADAAVGVSLLPSDRAIHGQHLARLAGADAWGRRRSHRPAARRVATRRTGSSLRRRPPLR